MIADELSENPAEQLVDRITESAIDHLACFGPPTLKSSRLR